LTNEKRQLVSRSLDALFNPKSKGDFNSDLDQELRIAFTNILRLMNKSDMFKITKGDIEKTLIEYEKTGNNKLIINLKDRINDELPSKTFKKIFNIVSK